MKSHHAQTLALAAALLLLAPPAFAQNATQTVTPDSTKSSPPKDAPPTTPQTNIDPKMAVPPVKAPPTVTNVPKAQDDSVKGKDDSVKKVPPAPSEPDKPGVRPL